MRGGGGGARVREVLAEIAQRRLMDTTAAVTWTALVRIHHPRTGPLCTLHLCACTCAHRTVYPLLVSFVMGMHRCRWDMGHITLAIGPRASCMAATRARMSYPPAARSRQQIPRAARLGGVGLSAHRIRHGTTTWGGGGTHGGGRRPGPAMPPPIFQFSSPRRFWFWFWFWWCLCSMSTPTPAGNVTRLAWSHSYPETDHMRSELHTMSSP